MSLEWIAGCLRKINRQPVGSSSPCLEGLYAPFYDGLLVDVDANEDEYFRFLAMLLLLPLDLRLMSQDTLKA